MTNTPNGLLKSSRKQAQLRKPFNERQLRFTKDGYTNLKHLQGQYEDLLGRNISESVALDIILTNSPEKYASKPAD